MENLEKILNKEQAEAVRCTEGPLLVLAGAGSGKTRVLTYRIAYLIENCGVEPWNILAITFTNKAAGEMRDRVDQLVGQRAGEVWVSTFHSMCVRILRRHIELIGYTGDFSIYDADDQRTVMRQVLKTLNVDPKLLKERQVLALISSAKNEGTDPEQFQKDAGGDLRMRRIADCYREYEKQLKANNALDFDDLLLKTVALFQKAPEVLKYYQQRFRYILVDEYQDTNDIQFQLVHQLADRYRNICVVGDDDQSIYAFRGANLENILSFEKNYPGARVIKLEQNYRSTQRILDTANAVISNNTGRKEKRLWTAKQGGEPVRFREYESAKDEAEAVIREAQSCGRPYRDQVVLYRTNAQSRLMEEQCVKYNVPYQVVGGVNFYQRKEIKDILAYMKVLSNDADDVAFERIINVPKRGIGATSIQKLRSYAQQENVSLLQAAAHGPEAGIGGKAAKELEKFVHMATEWQRHLRAAGLMAEAAEPGMEGSFTLRELIEAIRDDTGYGMELRSEGEVEAETRFQNIEEIISKAADYQAQADAPKLSEFLEEVSLVADLDRKDDSQDALTLMTLHAAKGLEFPKVYLVGLSEGLFPGFRSIGEPEELEEERRLCYVGITRAEQELCMSSARSRMVNGEYLTLLPSRFVDEMPEEVEKRLLYQPKRNRDVDDGDFSFRTESRERLSGSFFAGFGGNAFGGTFPGGSGISGGAAAFSYGAGRQKSSLGAKGSRKSGSGIPAYLKKGAEMPALTSLDYAEGDRVKHVKFGVGTVSKIEEDKKDFRVTVQFDSCGQKKIYARFAKLERI